MKAVYGATLRWPLGARYGNLILTRLPLLHTSLHSLPGGDEQRGLVEAHIQTEAGPVAVLCTHWGLSEEERVQQAEATVRIAGKLKMPLLMAGDLNEGPEGRGHARLAAAGLTPLGPDDPSFPSDDPRDRIDHVYGTTDWRASDGYTVPSLASDHRPVVVELKLLNAR